MAAITIRNLDERIKSRLRVRAARHGRSMEEEARSILRHALAEAEPPLRSLPKAIRRRFEDIGGVDIPPPLREPTREPPAFDE